MKEKFKDFVNRKVADAANECFNRKSKKDQTLTNREMLEEEILDGFYEYLWRQYEKAEL